MATRIETDSMGQLGVHDKYYGARTARSLLNFRIGTERMPSEVIQEFEVLKSRGPREFQLGLLAERHKCDLICQAADEVAPMASWMTTSRWWSGRPAPAPSPT